MPKAFKSAFITSEELSTWLGVWFTQHRLHIGLLKHDCVLSTVEQWLHGQAAVDGLKQQQKFGWTLHHFGCQTVALTS